MRLLTFSSTPPDKNITTIRLREIGCDILAEVVEVISRERHIWKVVNFSIWI
jgi:hypothetical protein